MKYLRSFFALFLALAAFARAETLLVRAAEFQFAGGWIASNRSDSLGPGSLRASGAGLNALTAIPLPTAGNYTVWARAVDFIQPRPGERRFTVALNGARLPAEAGHHGGEGWAWERLGTMRLAAGETAVELIDTSRFFARCDAVLLTTDDTLDPNTLATAALLRFRVAPLALKAETSSPPAAEPATPDTVSKEPLQELAALSGGGVRVRFVDAGGVIRRITEVAAPGSPDAWIAIPGANTPESLVILHSHRNTIETVQINPSWRNPANTLRVRVAGNDYTVGSDEDANPHRAAPALRLHARSARNTTDGGVELTFADDTGRTTAQVVWRLAPGGADFEVAATLTAWADGYYSIGSAPFSARDADDVSFNLLPPLYQFQRLPVRPRLVPSGITPQPLALIELPPDGALPSLTLGVAASPSELPFEWPSIHNSRYGFCLQSDDGRLQPTVFRPLLGLADSHWKTGETHTVRWRVIARAADWRDTLAYASGHIFNVTDHRHPVGRSLTESARAMIALMQDEQFGGWDAHLKGFLNIEAPDTATQSAPLAILSAAVLTEDETLYVARALPSIEYTLTRPSAHFATEVPDTQPVYANAQATRITSPSRFFGAAYWQGVHALLGDANPWMIDLVKRAAAAGPAQKWVPKFSDTLALHRLNPSPELLALAEKQATAWVAKEIDARKTRDLGYSPFYNHDFVPVWWDLLALHEATRNPRWLDAARTTAMLTVAGLRSQPAPATPDATITVHPDNRYTGLSRIWWKGAEPFRLGWPRQPGDVREHTVPAWQVSPVGLGLEQPSTFFVGSSRAPVEGFQNIMMSSWTPALLRLGAMTGEPIYRDFARNGIIGRFGNYPGYYLSGFTDLPQGKDYPTQGPDVTSIYYHHIPVHLAFTLDWLFAEAGFRSQNAIRFPWAQQAGYVWFNNRVYGESGGEIFGETGARPVLPAGVHVPDAGLNWIAARTAHHLWIVLMNDADTALPAILRLDDKALRLDSAAPVLVRRPGDTAPATVARARLATDVTVPPRGLVALAFPATSSDLAAKTLPPIAATPLAIDLGNAWGKLLAWRIRSPFGRDSIYVCLDGRPDGEVRAELLLEGDDATPRAAVRYPCEFSAYPFPADQDIAFRIRFLDSSGTVVTSDRFELPGAAP